jgi:hypothetical protein
MNLKRLWHKEYSTQLESRLPARRRRVAVCQLSRQSIS